MMAAEPPPRPAVVARSQAECLLEAQRALDEALRDPGAVERLRRGITAILRERAKEQGA